MDYPVWNGNGQEAPQWNGGPWDGAFYGAGYFHDPNGSCAWQPYAYPVPDWQYNYPPPEQYLPPPEQYLPPPEQYPPQPEPRIWDVLEDADEEAGEDSSQAKRLTPRRLLSVALNVLFLAACLVLIAGAIAFTFSNDPQKALFGYRIYSVISESMTPTVQEDGEIPKGGFYKGDAIIVKLALPEKVKPGDIITVRTTPEPQEGDDSSLPLTHRCMKVLYGHNDDGQIYFVTKGDHNRSYDPDPIPGSQLVGIKVLNLPKMGDVLTFVKTHKLVSILLSVAVLVLLFLLFVLFSRRPGETSGEKRGEEGNQAPPPPACPVPVFSGIPSVAEYPPHSVAEYPPPFGAPYGEQWQWQGYQQDYQPYDPSWQWYRGM
jgi:signal peptidase I